MLGAHLKAGRASFTGDLNFPQSPGDPHGLAAGGTLEVVIGFVRFDPLAAPLPAADRPEEGIETGVFHLPLLLVLGQQAEEQVHQHHPRRDEQGQEKPPKGRQEQKEDEPEEAVGVKAWVPLKK